MLAAMLLAALSTAGCTSQRKLVETATGAERASVRRETLLELYERATPRLRGTMERMLREEPDAAMRAMATEILVRIQARESAPELTETARRDVSWAVRADAVAALAALLGMEAEYEIERAMQEDSEPQVRLRALREYYGLVQSESDEKRTGVLEKALADPASIVRLRASGFMRTLTGLSAPPDLAGWNAARSNP